MKKLDVNKIVEKLKERVNLFRKYGMKRSQLIVTLAGLVLAWFVGGSHSAFGHTATGTTTVTFSSNPAPLGEATITTTTVASLHPHLLDKESSPRTSGSVSLSFSC